MKTEHLQTSHSDAQRRAVEVLRASGLVAFPTDTVYGLAAFPWDEHAVLGLYEAKQRPAQRAIPLLLSDASQLPRVATIPAHDREQIKKLGELFWPGALTLVLYKTHAVPEAVSHGATVAVRVPDLPFARALIRAAGGVLAVTSANTSGQPNPVTAGEVEEQLDGHIDLILDGGPCRRGVPSTILDCTTTPPTLLRRGAISAETLQHTLGAIKTAHEEH